MPAPDSAWLFLKDLLSKSFCEHTPMKGKYVKDRF